MERKMNASAVKLGTRVAMALLAISAAPVQAWDGQAIGTISTVEIAGATNFAFRITITGVSTMCAGGPNWAYLNEADSNYKVYVATLLAARAQGSTVYVYTNLENGYCRIGHLIVAG
jgi:hypothetical protein